MKASELRIGNLVIDTDDDNKNIAVRDGDDIDFAESYNPIPLTEEWLLKFGYEDNDMYDMGIESLKDGTVDFCYANTCLKIKHVHQLQNLYFALTGEELKLNK